MGGRGTGWEGNEEEKDAASVEERDMTVTEERGGRRARGREGGGPEAEKRERRNYHFTPPTASWYWAADALQGTDPQGSHRQLANATLLFLLGSDGRFQASLSEPQREQMDCPFLCAGQQPMP